MFRKTGFYFLSVLLFAFAACQKESLVDGRDFKTLGTSARDLLSSEKYTSLIIEVTYMAGHEPDTKSLDDLQSFLINYLNKPGGIQIISKQISGTGKNVLTLSELVQIERQNRTLYSRGSTLAVHVLIADADYSLDKDVLGISYWNTSFSLFGRGIFERSGSLGQIARQKLVATLLQHEFGHLLGLVGQGSPMQQEHRDQDNGAHCQNRSCLMYYGIETAENMGATTPIPVLDAPCMADLKANGGK